MIHPHCSTYKTLISLALHLLSHYLPVVYFHSIHDLGNISDQHHFLSREFCQVDWESHLFHKSNGRGVDRAIGFSLPYSMLQVSCGNEIVLS